MITINLILLIANLLLVNLFTYKIRTQAIVTLNVMGACFLINMVNIFFIPNTKKYLSWDLKFSNLLINVNTNIELANIPFTLDKISYLFLLLTTLLTPFALLTNWNSISIFNTKRLFFSLLLWIEIMLIITFTTLDLFIFYLGFEGLTIPVFFLIYLYGSEITKIRASLYFIIYSFLSSTFMALAIFIMYSQFQTTNILQLIIKYNEAIYGLVPKNKASHIWINYINTLQNFNFNTDFLVFNEIFFENTDTILFSKDRLCLLWILLFLAFIIKLPMVPFHMWLPEAHAEAPTSGSILLTGLILKLGGYGLYRFFIPLFGNFTYFIPLVHTLSIIGIIYIGLTCLKVNHIKQIIAYSSIVHMNAVCLGLFTNKVISFTGAIYSMLSHSLISSCLFMMAGILYNRYQSYYIENYSGLYYNMPVFSFFFIFILLANIAIPLTSGFIGELLILIDLSKYNLFIFLIFFTNYMVNTGYSIWLGNRLIFGDIKLNQATNKKYINYLDLNTLEICLLSLFVTLILFFGIYPNIILPFN